MRRLDVGEIAAIIFFLFIFMSSIFGISVVLIVESLQQNNISEQLHKEKEAINDSVESKFDYLDNDKSR